MNVTYPAASFRQNATKPPASDPLLTVQNLNVSFGPAHSRRAVVKGVSFTVEEGRCVAIVGESGSAKASRPGRWLALPGRVLMSKLTA